MSWFDAGKLCTFKHLSSLSITQHLAHCFVKDWIRKERLKFFCKTDLFLQYLLCAYLQEGCETSSKMFLCPWHTTIISDDFKFLRFFHRFHATRRAFSTRWIGEDAIKGERPWMNLPPSQEMTGLKQGDNLVESGSFPIVWRSAKWQKQSVEHHLQQRS